MVNELTSEVKETILQNLEGKLSREEAKNLREKLKDEFKVDYGSILKDVLCSNKKCVKPLRFTFANGPSCYHSDGGCGTIGTDMLNY